MATPPGLPAGHSFFAWGVCEICERTLSIKDVTAKTFSEVEADMKYRMMQHMDGKHELHVKANAMSVTVYSAARHDAPESEQTVHTEDPSAPAPAASRPRGGARFALAHTSARFALALTSAKGQARERFGYFT